MRPRLIAIAALALLPWGAGAQETEFVKRAQERLAALGFYSGPINGDFGFDTQAALAQFQLSRTLPASGQLDPETSLELGVARDASPDNPERQGLAAELSSQPDEVLRR